MIETIENNVRPGFVVIDRNYLIHNAGGRFVPVLLILGISDEEYDRKIAALKEEIVSSYATKDNIEKIIKNVVITGTIIGYLYLDEHKKLYDKSALVPLKNMLDGIFSLKVKSIDDYGRTGSLTHNDINSVYILKDLCVSENTINTFLLKRKLACSECKSYHALDEFLQAANGLVNSVSDILDMYTNISDTVYAIIRQEIPHKKVEKFVPGDLIIRYTAKRYRVLLVLGCNSYGYMTLLEISNEQHSYFSRIRQGTIEFAFRKQAKEMAKEPSDYLQTGFNIYPYFSKVIENELQR